MFLTGRSVNGKVRLVSGRPRSFQPEQVLTQAMGVFWKKGYEATGLADLEEATGLGRQSLYGAFGDKRALFAQVVEHYFDTILRPWMIDVLDNPACGGRTNIEALFASWQNIAELPEFHGCLVGNSVSELSAMDTEMAGVLRKKLQLMEDAFCRALRRAQASREVSAELDVRGAARALVTTAQGLAVLARVHREPAFVRSVIAGARRLLD
jgi:TetR/AcrR family transcriptional repressor of nem operon